MKLKNTPLASLISVSLLGSAALSQAGVLWADDFNSYADGGLAHQMGGGTGTPGWGANNWYSVVNTVNVTTGVVNGNGNVLHGLTATFADVVGATGTLWVSFDWGQNTAAVNFGGLTFFDDVGEKVLIGNTYNGETTWNMNGATPTAITTGGMHTAVAKITLVAGAANDIIELWVGPTGSPVNVSGPPLATTSDRDLENINRIRIMGGDDQTFDNLVIGTTMADVDATSGSDYVTWGTPYGLTAGTEDLDLDNDGVTNQEEYAFGLIPNSGASVNPITVQLDKSNGQFSYTRRNPSLPTPPLSYSIWYSTDLVTWLEDSGAVEGITSLNGDVQTVPVTISNGLLTDPKLFIQVRAN